MFGTASVAHTTVATIMLLLSALLLHHGTYASTQKNMTAAPLQIQRASSPHVRFSPVIKKTAPSFSKKTPAVSISTERTTTTIFNFLTTKTPTTETASTAHQLQADSATKVNSTVGDNGFHPVNVVKENPNLDVGKSLLCTGNSFVKRHRLWH